MRADKACKSPSDFPSVDFPSVDASLKRMRSAVTTANKCIVFTPTGRHWWPLETPAEVCGFTFLFLVSVSHLVLKNGVCLLCLGC